MYFIRLLVIGTRTQIIFIKKKERHRVARRGRANPSRRRDSGALHLRRG